MAGNVGSVQELRKTTGGAVRGSIDDGVASFLGVPYAAAPVGPRRFARPEPAVWEGERDATAPGPTAPQLPTDRPGMPALSPVTGPGWIPGSDYLTADVRTPDTADRLPVLVFLHGGAFVGGASRATIYDGTALAREGAVVITVNYRLGVPGFADLPGVLANRGLHDQIAALAWVHANAAAFGGDADRITVFGESAGALSLAALLAAAPPGLVRRAIVQSGGGSHVLAREQAAVTTAALAADLGVAPADLVDVPDEGLVAAVGRLAAHPPDLAVDGLRDPLMGLAPLGPVLDGELLDRQPVDAIAAGAAGEVDLLVGSTADEMALYRMVFDVLGVPAPDEDGLLAAVARLHPDPAEVVAAYRSAGRGTTPAEVADAVGTDWMFGVPTRRLADAHTGSTWRYRFDWRSPGHDGRLGASHALELPFVFDVVGRVDTGALAVTRHRGDPGPRGADAHGVGGLRPRRRPRLARATPRRPRPPGSSTRRTRPPTPPTARSRRSGTGCARRAPSAASRNRTSSSARNASARRSTASASGAMRSPSRSPSTERSTTYLMALFVVNTPSCSTSDSATSSSSVTGLVSLPETGRTRCTKRRSSARSTTLPSSGSSCARSAASWVATALRAWSISSRVKVLRPSTAPPRVCACRHRGLDR